MDNSHQKSWHVGQWPALAWLETMIKLAALFIGIITGINTLGGSNFTFPGGWSLVQWIILIILALGLLAAIFDRIADKEIVAMVFVVINNLGHWGMILGILGASAALLPWFAGLMLLGDLVKVVFIRVHKFTVREYGQRVLVGLTAVYITGYTLILLLELIK